MAKTVACRHCRCQPKLEERFDKILRGYRYRCICQNCDRSSLEWPTEDEAKAEWNARQEVLGWL